VRWIRKTAAHGWVHSPGRRQAPSILGHLGCKTDPPRRRAFPPDPPRQRPFPPDPPLLWPQLSTPPSLPRSARGVSWENCFI
jgi:hypothetical protein